jgi:hypothetical protein
MRLWYFSHDESAVNRVPIAVYVNTHSKVAIGTTALGQGLANVVHEVLLAAGRGADGLLLEFDLRHDGRSQVAQLAQWTGGVIRSRSRRGGLQVCESVAGRREDALSLLGICNNIGRLRGSERRSTC